jgi:hypothetical protein
MILKNRNSTPPGGFVFYYENPKTGEEIRVPTSGSANGLPQLTVWVGNAFQANGIPQDPDLGLVVEHQICIRQKNPLDICYNGGIGDALHHNIFKPLLKVASKAASRVSKSAAQALNKKSNCRSCGGTTTYKLGENNLGRAGSLNKLNSNKFAANADYK